MYIQDIIGNKNPYDVEFNWVFAGNEFLCENPIKTLMPDWDFQLTIIPIEKGKPIFEKTKIRYFKNDFNFDIG